MLFFFGIVGGLMELAEWLFTTIGALLPVVGLTIAIIAALAAIFVSVGTIVGLIFVIRQRRPWMHATGAILAVACCGLVLALVGVSIISAMAVAILS